MISHPGALSYTAIGPRRPSESTFVFSPAPQDASFGPGFSCQLTIATVLKGTETNHEARHQTAMTLSGMDAAMHDGLVDFLFSNNGCVPSMLESNACKKFNCQSDNLHEAVCTEYDVDKVLDLWNMTYREILPAFLAMVYPIEVRDPEIRLRGRFITHFRDRVLTPLLLDIEHSPRLAKLLYSVLFVVDNQSLKGTSSYVVYKEIMCRILGVKFVLTKELKTAALVPAAPIRTPPTRSQTIRPNRQSMPQDLSVTTNSGKSVKRMNSEMGLATLSAERPLRIFIPRQPPTPTSPEGFYANSPISATPRKIRWSGESGSEVIFENKEEDNESDAS